MPSDPSEGIELTEFDNAGEGSSRGPFNTSTVGARGGRYHTKVSDDEGSFGIGAADSPLPRTERQQTSESLWSRAASSLTFPGLTGTVFGMGTAATARALGGVSWPGSLLVGALTGGIVYGLTSVGERDVRDNHERQVKLGFRAGMEGGSRSRSSR